MLYGIVCNDNSAEKAANIESACDSLFATWDALPADYIRQVHVSMRQRCILLVFNLNCIETSYVGPNADCITTHTVLNICNLEHYNYSLRLECVGTSRWEVIDCTHDLVYRRVKHI